jgi:hypothetical protein
MNQGKSGLKIALNQRILLRAGAGPNPKLGSAGKGNPVPSFRKVEKVPFSECKNAGD